MANPNPKNKLPSSAQRFISKLQSDYPQITIKSGPKFSYRPPKTIFYGPYEPNFKLLLLHELGHALSGHLNYNLDLERLKIESEAWQKAAAICQSHPEYQVAYDSDFAESQLDSYRHWLHQKSLCPNCKLSRFQTPDGKYHCPLCDKLLTN